MRHANRHKGQTKKFLSSTVNIEQTTFLDCASSLHSKDHHLKNCNSGK